MAKLTEKALLMSLSISQWSGRKFDKKATNKIAADFGVKASAGRYNKILVDQTELAKIQKASGALRTAFYEGTLPWSDSDYRIRPTAGYMEFIDKLAKLQGDFDAAVPTFCDKYEDLIRKAEHELNGLFNRADYPTKDEIKGKFKVKISAVPVPETSDFRVDLSNQEIERLQKNLQASNSEAIKKAVLHTYNKVLMAVSRMSETLQDTDKKFKNSLTGNLQKIADAMPEMNLTNDKELTAIAEQIKQLVDVNPDDLRKKPGTRAQKAREAQELKNKVKAKIVKTRHTNIFDDLLDI